MRVRLNVKVNDVINTATEGTTAVGDTGPQINTHEGCTNKLKGIFKNQTENQRNINSVMVTCFTDPFFSRLLFKSV